jgi:hypothetical protein
VMAEVATVKRHVPTRTQHVTAIKHDGTSTALAVTLFKWLSPRGGVMVNVEARPEVTPASGMTKDVTAEDAHKPATNQIPQQS